MPNQHMQPDPAITLSFHARRPWRGAADVQRWPLKRSTKVRAVLQLIIWLSVCLSSFAAGPTNTPVRVTVSQFSRPPEDKIIVTSTNMIAVLVKLFPGYEGQPANKFLSGQWPVEYTVDITFADGHSRAIYVASNRWTAGAEHYTPMAKNWDELLGSMTSDCFKRTWSNMERLGQAHEPTTLIIGPCETLTGRGGDIKGQPDGTAKGSQPIISETNSPSPAAGSHR